MILPDILASNLKLIICGTAAGSRSAKLSAYYAQSTNKFWKTLHTVGLTPVQFQPHQFTELLHHGIGLTDLVPYASGMDRTLKRIDYDLPAFEQKIQHYQPKYLCFNGKKAAEMYLGHHISFGLQPETIAKTQIFVAPSTSGNANGFWDLAYWYELARLCNK